MFVVDCKAHLIIIIIIIIGKLPVAAVAHQSDRFIPFSTAFESRKECITCLYPISLHVLLLADSNSHPVVSNPKSVNVE